MYNIEKDLFCSTHYYFASNTSARFLKHSLLALELAGIKNPIICNWKHGNASEGYSIWLTNEEKFKAGDVIVAINNLTNQHREELINNNVSKEWLDKNRIYIGCMETDEEIYSFCMSFIKTHNWQFIE